MANCMDCSHNANMQGTHRCTECINFSKFEPIPILLKENDPKISMIPEPDYQYLKSALKKQTGGQHYKDKAIQPIEYIHANKLGFCEGNVVKYITRHKEKNGAEDIRKVIHYCELLLELEYKNESNT